MNQSVLRRDSVSFSPHWLWVRRGLVLNDLLVCEVEVTVLRSDLDNDQTDITGDKVVAQGLTGYVWYVRLGGRNGLYEAIDVVTGEAEVLPFNFDLSVFAKMT